MPYYLQHYFDPDFDYLNRKPTSAAVHGQISSLHTLGFVQNVIDGQIIAEIIPLESAGPNPDPRFIMDTPHFPAGDNVKVDPSYPQYLLAATNGYVFYYQGKMTVKNLPQRAAGCFFQNRKHLLCGRFGCPRFCKGRF